MTVLLATCAAFGGSFLFLRRAGLAAPWMALLAFLCFLGLARVAEPIVRLSVPEALQALRPWELEGEVYRSLAVPQFGAMLRDTPLRVLNSSVYLTEGRRDPVGVLRQVESAEAIHFWGAVLLVPWLAWCALSGRWVVLACFLLVEIVGNAYPIMHLRAVRGRLECVRRRAHGASRGASRSV